MAMKAAVLRRLYAYAFLDDFIFIYPLYQLMFASRGLSVGQISWLFVIWSVAALAAEIPTCVLADKFSRTKLLAIGQIIKALGFGTWLVWPEFWGFAAGFVLWGIGSAFDSGTFQALIYDELDAGGQRERYVRVRGRAESWRLVGNLVGTASATLIVGFGFETVLALSILAPVLGAVVAWTLPSAPAKEQVDEIEEAQSVLTGVVTAFKHPAMLGIVLFGGFVGAVYGSLEEYTALFFQAQGAALASIPLLEASLVLAAVAASFVAHRFERLGGRVFTLILGVSGAVLLASAITAPVVAIALMMSFFFTTKLVDVIFDGKLQHSITGSLRATVTSVAGFAVEILSIATYLVFGSIADARGTLMAFEVFGLVTLVVAGVYVLAGRRLLRELPN